MFTIQQKETNRSTSENKQSHEVQSLSMFNLIYTLCLKNDTGVAHYNLNAHQSILVFLAEMLPRQQAIK